MIIKLCRLAAVSALSLVLAACSRSEPLVGTWYRQQSKSLGPLSASSQQQYTFNADGTGLLVSKASAAAGPFSTGGEGSSRPIKWERQGSKIVVEELSGDNVPAIRAEVVSLTDQELILEKNGEKQPFQKLTPPK